MGGVNDNPLSNALVTLVTISNAVTRDTDFSMNNHLKYRYGDVQ